MTVRPDTCLGRIWLGRGQVTWLADRPCAAHQVPRQMCCELELGHDGPHAALGQQCEEGDWWIRWTLAASEVVEAGHCPAQGDTRDALGDTDVCLLFNRHPGRHSFELTDGATLGA